ncbi:PglL family O-oligosaccharyltransferase [Kluyvera intermedia]|uniref:PglL family O-oligosaccharyltransferase n=1 Tax=Kluyvera intermedia TaxID=61648 RepID=UPI003523A1ED
MLKKLTGFNSIFSSTGQRGLFIGLTSYLLIIMHIAWPNHGGSGAELPLNLIAWCIIFGLCAFYWYYNFGQQVIWGGMTGFILLAGATLMTLPVIWSPSLATVLYALPRIMGLWGGLIFWLTLRQCHFSDQCKVHFFYCLSVAGTVEAGVVLMELYVPRHGLPSIWLQLVQRYGRAGVGVFQQVNVTASFLALTLASTLLLLGWRKVASQSRLLGNLLLMVLVVGSILQSAVLTAIYSRTGWLTGLLVIGGVYYLFKSHRFREEGQYQVFLILLPLIGMVIGMYLLHMSIAQALEKHDGSNHQRLLTLYHTFFYAIQHPLIGYGAGTYEGSYQAYLAAMPGGNPGNELMTHPHNEFLYQYAEGGLIAVLGLLLWCGLYLHLWWKVRTVLQAGALMAMLPVLIHTQLEYPLYYSVPHWIVLLLLIRMADEEYCPQKIKRGFASFAGRFFILPLMLAGTVISFQAYRSGQVLDRFETGEIENPELIATLNVPLVLSLRYKQDLSLLRLYRFQNSPDTASLLAFSRENEEWLSVHAWSPLYINQIAVMHYLGDEECANLWLQKARTTLPWKPEFKREPGE